jgi:molecular chaperone DnaK
MAKTVDYGIDLGTTNSGVARMTARGVEIIPVNRLQYIPSAVATDKRGDIKIGLEALSPHLEFMRWFKRNMGTQVVEQRAGRDWTPQQLSAEVLKGLKAAVKLKTNEDIRDVVITVPAMFSQPQCAATHEAATLAGLNAVVLLQEPIAAATAYLSESPIEGNYLVFDLGGGTFDASIIRLKAAEMNVVGHGGDNYLGGADFDRSVFDWVLDEIDRKAGNTTVFETGAPRRQLFAACEEARAVLSSQDQATIYLDDFDLPIAKLELSREILEDLVEEFVTRTIEVAQDRLAQASLRPEDVNAILLVGGPTQMPYVRRRLAQELGISLNLDQDPMTVVAKGAAIHASTILRDEEQRPAQTVGVHLRLHYEPVSPDESTTVAGSIIEPQGFAGEIRIRASRGSWETGWKVLINGAFSVEVALGGPQLTDFLIELRDMQGSPVAVTPNTFVIRSGVRAAQPVTPYNYGVVLEGGRKVGQIVGAGQPLPASGSAEFKLAKTLIAGSPDELKIHFVEGLSPLAEENSRVGEVTIRGTDIKRTLKEDEAVDIRVRMDESRMLKGRVYIPSQDLDYAVEMQTTMDKPDEADMRARVRETKSALDEIEDHIDESEQEIVMRAVRQIDQIQAGMERVQKGEIGEAEKVNKQISDAQADIRDLRDKYGLLARHSQLVEFIAEASTLCQQFNDRLGMAKLQDLRDDADKALRLKKEKLLESVFDRVRDVFWEHYGKTSECWEHQVHLMHQSAHMASDPLTYHELVRKAEAALRDSDYDGVLLHYLQSREMLPAAEQLKNRFHNAGIR